MSLHLLHVSLLLLVSALKTTEEAEAMHRQTLARREEVLGREQLDTLGGVCCLAGYLAHQHCYSEALALYDRASAGYQAVLGKDHPTTRACHQDHVDALASHGQSELGLFPTIVELVNKGPKTIYTVTENGLWPLDCGSRSGPPWSWFWALG